MQKTNWFARIKAFFRTPRGTRAGLWGAYFLYWASLAPFIPYVALYYENINLTGTQIGQLGSIRSMISFISSILLAFLSDLLRRRKLILRVCVLGMTTALLIFPHAASFVTLIPIVMLYSVFLSPTSAILDQTTLETLDNPRNFSKVRMGGSVGWGILVFITGWLLDNAAVNLTIIFHLHIILLILLFAFSWLLPEGDRAPGQKAEKVSLKDVWEMLRLPAFLPWMGIIFLWGVGDSSIITFLFLHIKHLGGSSSLMGAVMSAGILGEIIGFSAAKRIQHKVGTRTMMILSFAVLCFWLIAASYIKQPTLFLLFMVIAGTGFALMLTGSVAYVNQRAPENIGTTAQAIRGAIQMGLGSGVGALISGALYQAYGSAALYRIMGAVAFVGFLLALLLRYVERSHEKNISNNF